MAHPIATGGWWAIRRTRAGSQDWALNEVSTFTSRVALKFEQAAQFGGGDDSSGNVRQQKTRDASKNAVLRGSVTI